jgi:hypothetical protein
MSDYDCTCVEVFSCGEPNEVVKVFWEMQSAPIERNAGEEQVLGIAESVQDFPMERNLTKSQ